MIITIRLASDEDIPTMARIRSEEWGDPAFWMDRITWYEHGKHSPQQALPERAIFVAVDEGSKAVLWALPQATEQDDLIAMVSCNGSTLQLTNEVKASPISWLRELGHGSSSRMHTVFV